jgi:hypothetical protein
MLRLLSNFATKRNERELTPITNFMMSAVFLWILMSHCGCQVKVFHIESGTYVCDALPEIGEEAGVLNGNTLHSCIE